MCVCESAFACVFVFESNCGLGSSVITLVSVVMLDAHFWHTWMCVCVCGSVSMLWLPLVI